MELQKYKRLVKDKEISECRFQVQKGDALVLVSDGVTHAGVGKSGKYKFGWPWESVAEFVSEQCLTSLRRHVWRRHSVRNAARFTRENRAMIRRLW
ncbi:MAG: hypothetical protein ACLT76_12785 [Clostridium fessum]